MAVSLAKNELWCPMCYGVSYVSDYWLHDVCPNCERKLHRKTHARTRFTAESRRLASLFRHERAPYTLGRYSAKNHVREPHRYSSYDRLGDGHVWRDE